MTEKVTELLKKKNLDAILISDGYNMRYLSGFGGATGYLYISADQKVLMTDSRYTTQAKQEAPKFAVVEVSTEKGYRELITECIRKDQAKTIGFEDQQMICADFKKISSPTKDEATWMELGEEVNLLRCIKTEEELEKVAKAEAIGDQAFQKILGDIKPGVTELTIAAKLDYYMRELGAEGNSFDTIVASGLHSAMPHAVPTAKKLEKGDFITMDFGCRYDGYCSDMTRTVVLGEASSKQKEIYGIVLKAQMAALEQICAGKTGSEVDQVARGLIAEAGYGEYFGHGLGHSVGLFIHEEPRLSPKCHSVLQKNMTMTVEPGIYIPEFGGVRIEDLVVITEKGCRNLAHTPKELIEL